MEKLLICLYCGLLFAISGCNTHVPPTSEIKAPPMNKTGPFLQAPWIQNSNVYEVNLRQYSPEGTITAFAKALPRLREMGVETLWFMPLTPIAEKNRKGTLGSQYACKSYTEFSSEYGTLQEFKDFVKQAHDMGFKVIIDWVANHTGWDHEWTVSHPEYYLIDSATQDFQIASGMDDIIELDFSNPQLRREMIDAMRFWVTETDIDGFRCDLAFWVELDFWMEARTSLEKTKNLFWLAELDPLENPEYMEVFDAAYTWTWMHKTKEYYEKGMTIDVLDTTLQRYDTAGGSNRIKLWFTTNHDENSWNGTEYEKYGEMAEALAVFSFTWPGIPLIYSGQEMPNKKRLEFFEKDPIAWTGEYKLADFYKTLAKLRKENPALRAGDSSVTTYRLHTLEPQKHLLAYLRKKGKDEVLVLLNMGKENIRFELNEEILRGNFVDVFDKKNILNLTNSKTFAMPSWAYFVFEKKDDKNYEL